MKGRRLRSTGLGFPEGIKGNYDSSKPGLGMSQSHGPWHWSSNQFRNQTVVRIVRIPLPNGKILEGQAERPEKDLDHLHDQADEKKLSDIRIIRDSRNLHRFAPSEMVELSISSKESSEKGFFDQKFTHGQHLCSFVKKRTVSYENVYDTGNLISLTIKNVTLFPDIDDCVLINYKVRVAFSNIDLRSDIIRCLEQEKKDSSRGRVRAMSILFILGLKTNILEAQRKLQGSQAPTERLRGLRRHFEPNEMMVYSVHPGAHKMYYDLRDLYWWPGMKRDIAEYVRRCSFLWLKIKANSSNTQDFLATGNS
ncbi:putative reverse transcriptase domain-containing protein [Tanacetum coccineum]